MNLKIIRKGECIGRVHFFGTREDMVFTPKETELFVSLAPIKAGLDAAATQQSSGNREFREGANERQAAARALRMELRDVAEIAKSLHERGVDVGAIEAFRMPKSAAYANLKAAANTFAERAEPRKALFIERGLPETFVEDLQAHALALGGIGETSGSGRGTQVGGTAGLELMADEGLKIVRELRSILRVKFRSTPALLAEWNAIARVHQPAYRQAATTPPAEPPPSGDPGSGS